MNARSVVAVTGDVWGGAHSEKHFVTIFVLCDLKDDVDEVQVRFLPLRLVFFPGCL